MTDPILDRIVRLTVSTSGQTPSRPAFNVPLVLASVVPTNWGANLVRSFGSAPEVVAAIPDATNEARILAETVFSQSPHPSKILIAKRSHIPTRKAALTINGATEGDIFAVKLSGVSVSVTAGATPTATTVATSLATAIGAATGAGFTATSALGVVTITASTAGSAPSIEIVSGDLTLEETTTDPGVTSDLDAVLAENGDWYGLLIDVEGAATIEAASTWATTNERWYSADTSDSACTDNANTDDVISTVAATSTDHVSIWYSHRKTNSHFAAAAMGRVLAYDPGTINAAYKELKNVSVQTFGTSVFDTIDAKRGNVYCKVQGASMTWQGRMAGSGWIDETLAIDYVKADIKINYLSYQLNVPKLPYTQFGLDQLVGIVDATLSRNENSGLLDGQRGHTVSTIAISETTQEQRDNREFPIVNFTAYLQGAGNTVQIVGTLTP